MNNSVVTFFTDSDICKSRYYAFGYGCYEQMSRLPRIVVAKINPNTTLTLYTGVGRSGRSKTYNNTYGDRYVVVMLPEFKIASFVVEPYVMKHDIIADGLHFSITDILLIFVMLLL